MDKLLKCYNRLKLSLDKNTNDKLYYTTTYRFLEKLGFDPSEIRVIYSLYITNGKNSSILPHHWLDLYFKDVNLITSPTGFIMERNNNGIADINYIKHEITISNSHITPLFINYYGIPQKEVGHFVKDYFKHYCHNVALVSVSHFEIIVTGYESAPDHIDALGTMYMMNNNISYNFLGDRVFNPNDGMTYREDNYRSFFAPNYKIRYNDY